MTGGAFATIRPVSSDHDADKPNETAQTEIDPKSLREQRDISSRAVSVLGTQTFSERASKDPKVQALEAQEFEDRYQSRAKLGEGGMGEVRLCRDGRIGRDVAMKVIRTDRHRSAEMRARFLREVRVQGQLEHPSIVPVYDLGTGKDGETYFTMKRVRGQNLADILDSLRLGEPAAIAQYSQRKLLAAFQSVCLAIEFAHSRGVLHRDLKPTNIMLGAFGEVYVLDWGIAKIMNEDEAQGPSSKVQDSDFSLETQVGAFVGTLGYLSPEQFSGEALDPRSDVFALGTILFELLTLVPLFEGKPIEIAQQICEPCDARCSVRRPEADVPPELEAICINATALERDDRIGSARELNDLIQRYLDGDRDLERRRAFAEKHLTTAGEEMELARSSASDAGPHRAKALGELGRALALDPTNEAAMGDIVSLLLEPPHDFPQEVKDEIEASNLHSIRIIGRTGAFTFLLGLVLLLPLLTRVHPGERLLASLVIAAIALSGVLSLSQVKRPSHRKSYVVMVACALGYVGMSRLYGPFVLMPAIVMATAMTYAMHPLPHIQRMSFYLMFSSIAVPIGLELTGIWAPAYDFRDGVMMILPRALDLHRTVTMVVLSVVTLFLIYAGSAVIQRARNALTHAEARLLVQSWQFRQLAPEGARTRVKNQSGVQAAVMAKAS